jgi:hypothetical protein
MSTPTRRILAGLLRTRGEWIERRRAADNGDEFPPLHALQGHGGEHSTSHLGGLRRWQGSQRTRIAIN